jgi:hypothetical protein
LTSHAGCGSAAISRVECAGLAVRSFALIDTQFASMGIFDWLRRNRNRSSQVQPMPLNGADAAARFVARHPPASTCTPLPTHELARWSGALPASLLSILRHNGIGHYGDRPITIIDPARYQPLLDTAIVAAGEALARVPFAVLPFGELLYWRRLPEGAEDVCLLDLERRSTEVLSWDCADFFATMLCNDAELDAIIDAPLLEHARRTQGALNEGEFYWVDRRLESLSMLPVERRVHVEHAQAVVASFGRDAEAQVYAGTVARALPQPHAALFSPDAIVATPAFPWAGIYVSARWCWHKALALRNDGSYVLVFWDSEKPPHSRLARCYQGDYVQRGEEIHLTLEDRDDSPSSDFWYAHLLATHDASPRMLFVHDSLPSIADAIHWRSVLDEANDQLIATTLDAPMQEFPDDGIAAPPWSMLPSALQAMTPRQPYRATIVSVDVSPPDVAHNDGEGNSDVEEFRVTVHCDDARVPFSINRPLCSPAGAGKDLLGWLSDDVAGDWQVRIRAQRDDSGRLIERPAVGDALTSRVPGLPPLG